MQPLIPILSLVIVLVVSLLIIRTATIALTYTGLSRESARFQARSAFTGVGFTTSESESVVSHPVRRRVLMLLMLLGNAGIITVMSSVVIALSDVSVAGRWWLGPLLIIGGVGLVSVLATSAWVERRLEVGIDYALRRFTDIDVRDYAKLLHLAGEYSVVEVLVEQGRWLADRSLAELGLDKEGCVVLGVRRSGGEYLGAPQGRTRLAAGDVVMVYGRVGRVEKISRRYLDAAGESCRLAGVEEQREAIELEAESGFVNAEPNGG